MGFRIELWANSRLPHLQLVAAYKPGQSGTLFLRYLVDAQWHPDTGFAVSWFNSEPWVS